VTSHHITSAKFKKEKRKLDYKKKGWLRPSIWDGLVEVDIVRMKKFSEGNLINMNKCTV